MQRVQKDVYSITLSLLRVITRKGAGRKPGPTVRVSIRLTREVWASIEREAASRGTTPDEEAARILT